MVINEIVYTYRPRVENKTLISFIRMMVIIWADLFAAYVMWLMMVYLTDVWKLDFTHAAAIVNLWMGSVLVLPTLFGHLADAFVGHFLVLFLTSLSYTAGLTLIWISTKSSHDHHGKVLLYIGLSLTAVGMAGHLTSHAPFTADQTGGYTQITVNKDSVSSFVFAAFTIGSFASVLFPLAGILVLTFVKPWAIRFGICAIFTTVSTLVFLSGICSYNYVGPQGSPFTTVFRVIFATLSKIIYRRPRSSRDLYERNGLSVYDSLPHTNGLRCLDKAAIILPDQPLEQQEQKRWKLCSVTEVEETKIILRLIPISITFILCGLVSAIGDTYFLEQANHLNRKLGRLKVPLIVIFWFHNQMKQLFAKLYVMFSNCFGRSDQSSRGRYVPPIGIAVAMIFSILCCITAAKVESRRLGVVKSHDLVDKPDERIPMSVFWLLPQIVLLGALDGIFNTSVTSFFLEQAPPTMLLRNLMTYANSVFGVGIMGSALSVYIVENISKRDGKQSWFQSTLNKSRLDNYYWVLAALSAGNFVLYVVIAIFYRYNKDSGEELEDPGYEFGADDCFQDIKWCCC